MALLRPSTGVIAALATTLIACSILTNLDGLSGGAGSLGDAGAATPDDGAGDAGGTATGDDSAADRPMDGAGVNDATRDDSAGDRPTDGAGVNDGTDSSTGGWDASSDSESSDSHAPSITRVQAIAPVWQFSATATLTLHENAGDLLVAGVYFTQSTVNIAVADTLGNTWTSTPAFANLTACNSNGGVTVAQIFYAEGVAGGDNVVTVTQSSGNAPLGAFLVEYSGIQVTGALDGVVGASAPSSTSTMSVGSLTTTGTLDVVVALFAEATTSGVIAPGSGFGTAAGDTSFYSMIEDDLPAGMAPGTVTPTATEPGGMASDCWVGAAAAFRAAP